MKIGILGSGRVGQTLGSKLLEQGHEVRLGARNPGKLAEWLENSGNRASAGSLAEAAAFGELLFNCTTLADLHVEVKFGFSGDGKARESAIQFHSNSWRDHY